MEIPVVPLKMHFLGHLGDSWAAHVVPVPPSPYANVASAMIPDGGLHCNLDSWQRYLAAHLAEDEDFLPKDMWTYIHTPITQGFYGFGWMIDNSNDDIGVVVRCVLHWGFSILTPGAQKCPPPSNC